MTKFITPPVIQDLDQAMHYSHCRIHPSSRAHAVPHLIYIDPSLPTIYNITEMRPIHITK
jgi:hypothetical protein